MNVSAIQATLRRSNQGEIAFPEVINQLQAEGVESYQVDLRRDEVRCYWPDGRSQTMPLELVHPPVALAFDAGAVAAAVRAAQQGKVNYPGFVSLAVAAGTTGYVAYLAGKKVVYTGRLGDSHTEHFPQPAPKAS